MTESDKRESRTRNVLRPLEILSESGVSTLLKKIPPYLYQKLWPYLPQGNPIVKNEVEVSTRRRVLDGLLPDAITRYVPSDDPDYEAQYLGCIQRHVTVGEKVVLVGGGEGVSTVVAGNCVGPTGSVTVYEGGHINVDAVAATVRQNGVAHRTSVRHAIVATNINLHSSPAGAPVVAPSDLPACDTLAIDADGAELPILEGLTNPPQRVIVEHHAVPDDDGLAVDYRPEVVRNQLADLGFCVVEEVADPTGAFGLEERIFVAEK